MTERRPASPSAPSEPATPRWDPGAIRDALDPSREAHVFALPSPTPDPDDVAGVGLVLGDPPRAVVELYPAQQRLLVRTPGVRLELDGIEPPTIGPEGVVFERTSPTHALWLSLGRGGELAFHSAPVAPLTSEGPTIAAAAPDVADRPIGGPNPETPAAGHPAAPGEVPGPASATPRNEGKEEKQERVTVYGRLATDVRFKTHATGRLIGEFVLAERIDEEQTKFHRVTAFDNPQTERFVASKLRQLVDAGELAKARPASVVGYIHLTERKKRDGTTVTEQQIYAVTVRAR